MAKINNFNEMRKVLVLAHNGGNTKPVSKELCEGVIDVSYFTVWVADVRKLQEVVEKYVDSNWSYKFSQDNFQLQQQVAKNRIAIYTAWKELLAQAEESTTERKLHVDESDIEALVKFAWDFIDTGAGTGMCHVDQKKFRRFVESYIGCIIAQNAVLTDEERDVLQLYKSLVNQISGHVTREENLNKELLDAQTKEADTRLVLESAGVSEENIVAMLASAGITKKIDDLKTAIEDNANKQSEKQMKLDGITPRAKAIQVKMKYAE